MKYSCLLASQVSRSVFLVVILLIVRTTTTTASSGFGIIGARSSSGINTTAVGTSPSSSSSLSSPCLARSSSSDSDLGHSQSLSTTPSPYLIILDGGSTGSRLHVFQFVEQQEHQLECIRLGSHKAPMPLTAFANDVENGLTTTSSSNIADHLMPSFEYAATLIPSHYHAQTRVLYQATAGMRLLSPQQQEHMYQTLHQQLVSNPNFVFDVQRSDIATLSGEDEGFYGVVAANYLEGAIQGNMVQNPNRPLVGSLDMGGSSTQIVFLPQQEENKEPQNIISHHQEEVPPPVCHVDSQEENVTCVPPPDNMVSNNEQQQDKLNTDGFFIHSYLSYGVDQFRMRLWKSWILHHQEQLRSEGMDASCDAKLIQNPCVFKGYTIDYEGYTLIGTGNTGECVQKVQTFLLETSAPTTTTTNNNSTTTPSSNNKYSVGGIQHPPVRGKFYAMSNYFYTLDTVRQFVATSTTTTTAQHAAADAAMEIAQTLQQSWPTPTLNELSQALPIFCNQAWQTVELHHETIPHAYTQPHLLPHRCLDAVYMTTLLRDGFGFDPNARDITFALHVQESEVEWTLGMALVLKNSPSTTSSTTSTSSTEQPQLVPPLLVEELETSELLTSSSLSLSSPSSLSASSSWNANDKEQWEQAEDGQEDVAPQQQENLQNDTTTTNEDDEVNKRTNQNKSPFFSYYYYSDALDSTRKLIWQRFTDFIVTVSALDYLHTI